jgi:exonuclease III
VNDHFDNPLALFHQNIRGLSGKSEEIINSLMDEELNPNVMCFTEHHIPELSPGFINLENYICFSRSRHQKGGVCIFVQKNLFFNCVDLSKFCEERTTELCAIQLDSKDKQFIIICVYRAPSGDSNLFLQSFDEALKSLYKPKVEFLICGDMNTDYLLNSSRKQQFPILLNTYNTSHTVTFPTRFEKDHASAIVENSRLFGCMVFPLSNGLSDHNAHV